MEVSDLIARTENSSWIDACVELPPNQCTSGEPSWVLIGKLITFKEVGVAIVTEVVNKAWRPAFQVRVTRLDNKLYKFSFLHEADMTNAFRRRPWSIRGGHLVLKHWNPSLTWQEIPFSSSTFWVQVHDLPDLWRSPANIRRLGEKAGKVVEVDFAGEGDGSWRRFIRIQVEVDLLQPLMPGIFLPRNNLPYLWISLRYEKLADVCYRCGIIGHEARACGGKMFCIRNPFGHNFTASGPWLRAESNTSPPEIFLDPNPPVPSCHAGSASSCPDVSSPVTACNAMAPKKDKVHEPSRCAVHQESGTNNMSAQILPTSLDAVSEAGASTPQLTTSPTPQLTTSPTHVSHPAPTLSDKADETLTKSPPSRLDQIEKPNRHYPEPLCPPICLDQSENPNPPYPPGFGPASTSPNTNLSPKPKQNAKTKKALPQINKSSQQPLLSHRHSPRSISKILTKALNTQTPPPIQAEPCNPTPLPRKRKLSQKEEEILSKRVKFADHVSEANLLDTAKANLITTAGVEQHPSDQVPTIPLGELCDFSVHNLKYAHGFSNSPVISESCSVFSTAEEAGLIKPPTSP